MFIRKFLHNLKKQIKILYKLTIIKYTKEHRIFLFGAPSHTNLGDQAQTFCIEKWVKTNYPNSTLFIYTADSVKNNNYLLLQKIAKLIVKTDLILIQSGYNTTDLYMNEENLHRAALSIFRNNKVVILPQTIFFKSNIEKQNTINIYNKHPNAIFLSRDEVSFKESIEMFPNLKLSLYPDIVTTLIGDNYENSSKKMGIMLCIRNDKESIYDKETRSEIINSISHIGNVIQTDTTLKCSLLDLDKNRKKYIEEAVREYSSYKVVVTDRYHGTIFSLIAGTPVIILATSDHKVTTGANWFTNLPEYDEYIFLCNDISDLPQLVTKVYNKNKYNKLSPYFKVQYYDKLKNFIEG